MQHDATDVRKNKQRSSIILKDWIKMVPIPQQPQLLFLFLLLGFAPVKIVESLSSSSSSSNSNSVTHQFQLGNDQQSIHLNLHKVYLRQNSPSTSPWCYALTVNPILYDDDDDEKDKAIRKHQQDITKIQYNFLASQVWPSARVAASICEEHIPLNWKVCELGCGPALPSLTIAKKRCNNNNVVIATDIDELALQMSIKAADEQQIDSSTYQTKYVDLMGDENILKQEINADLYILSDVFESKDVSIGSARMVYQALMDGSRVWVFAQSDRGLREVFKDELIRYLLSNEGVDDNEVVNTDDIEWKTLDRIDMEDKTKKNSLCDRLRLLDFDETQVNY